MKTLPLSAWFSVLGGGLFLIFCGCLNFEPVSDPTRTFVLGIQGVDTVQAGNKSIRLDVDRVEIPSYLEDRRLLIRKTAAEIEYQEFLRWAEPLRDGIARVVAANLSQHASISGVSHYPWKQNHASDYKVRLQILRFEVSQDGLAQMEVLYEILPPDSREKILIREKRKFSRETSLDSTEDQVAALSGLLKQLSEAILADLLKS